MAALAKEAGMPALAITDTGNLFGALEFSEALAEKGIQPIIGCTLKVDFADVAADAALRPQHGLRKLPSLALLAKDETGYRHLMKLSSRAYLDTADNAEPHVPWNLLEQLQEGLICLTGGPAGARQRGAGPGPEGAGTAAHRAAQDALRRPALC